MDLPYDLRLGDSRDVLKELDDNSIDLCATDPPYALESIVKRFGGENAAPAKEGNDGFFARKSAGFMNMTWDTGEVAFDPAFWAEVYRVLKPGAWLFAFGGTRTYHKLAMAIDCAGFEVMDMIPWHYGQGQPFSTDFAAVPGSKGSADGRQVRPEFVGTIYEGGDWGTDLKAATEPICMAMKPLSEKTIAANVLRWGVGGILNIAGNRVALAVEDDYEANCSGDRGHDGTREKGDTGSTDMRTGGGKAADGRWPANVMHDGSPPVVAQFASAGERGASAPVRGTEPSANQGANGIYKDRPRVPGTLHDDSGTADRFFTVCRPDDEDVATMRLIYESKASTSDREEGCGALPVQALARSNQAKAEAERGNVVEAEGGGFNKARARRNIHPTVKPTALMRTLISLGCPPGGVVLDPFLGSGSTGKAAMLEGVRFIGIEREAPYLEIAKARVEFGRLRREVVPPNGDLFAAE